MNIQSGSDSKVNTIQKHKEKKNKDKAFLRSLMNAVLREIKYKLNFWTLGITALLIAFSILIVFWKPFPGLEEWTKDYRQRSRLAGMNNLIYPTSALSKFKNNLPLPSSEEYSQCFDVCIITEDEKSIHDLDGTPFSPEEYAQVVYMLQEFGVDVIVFDKLFFEERKKHFARGYENMLKAIERAKDNGINTVVGWKYDIDPDSENNDLKAYGPTADVRALTKKGFINVILSQTDKGVREYSFLYPEGASLAMSAYLSAINPDYSEDVSKIVEYFSKNKNVSESEIAVSQLTVDENDKISKPRTIEFYGKPGTIPVHPFHELIRAFHILYPEYAKCRTYEEKFSKLKEILESGANEELQELLAERAEYVEDIKKLETSKQGKSDEEIETIEANIETLKTDFIDEIDLEIAEIKESLKGVNTNVLEKLDKSSWSTKDQAFFDRLQKSLSRKVAVIGPWTLDSQDLYNVPITTSADAEARMYGVEIHATMIQNLFDIMNSSDPKVLDGFTYPDDSENIEIVIGVVIFTALITMFITPLWSAALMILAAILYWFGASYSFVYNTHFYPIVYPVFAMLSTFVIMTVTKFFATDKQRRQIDGMFKSYVDRKFVDLLKRDPSKIKLGGERKEISVFFSDIAGFSTFSESMEPEEIVEVLNKYLGAMTEIILE